MLKPRILIVEDELLVAENIRNKLENLRYEVVAIVASGAEAIHTATALHPDVILMDITLSGELDGVETAARIHTRINIPIIYLTAHADDATLKRAKVTAPFGYLLKPFRDRELRTTIEVALYKHKLECALQESEYRLKLILNNSGDIIVMQDLEGRYIYFKATPRYGVIAGDVLGKTPFDFFDQDTAVTIMTTVDRVAKTGQDLTVERQIVWNKEAMWFKDYLYPIVTALGEIVGVGTISHNITAQKQAELEIADLRKLIPMCAWCKSVRDEQEHWRSIENYIQSRLDVGITNGICDNCLRKYFPEAYEKLKGKDYEDDL